ncbi:MAG: TetR/AcrR family transcriptional regulator [Pseudomonadota bacterium]
MQTKDTLRDFEGSLDSFAYQRFGNRSGSGVHEKGRETLKGILGATIEILAERGFSDFSMRKVAAHLGMKLSAVQYYFPTRDDLLRSLGKFVVYRYDIQQKLVIDQDYETPLARLEAYIDFSLERVRDQAGNFIMLGEAQTGSAVLAEAYKEVYALDLDVLSRLLRPLLPDATKTELRQRAAFMSASIDGLEIYLKTNPKLTPSVTGLAEFSKAALLQVAIAK